MTGFLPKSTTLMKNIFSEGPRGFKFCFDMLFDWLKKARYKLRAIAITKCLGIMSKRFTSQLTAEKANTSDDQANYLDLTFIIESNNRLYTKLYDKRDDFDFHIVNFPFLSSNIPSGPSYGVYISQLKRY